MGGRRPYTRINGLAVTSVLTVLSEIGPDLSRFANVKHFARG